MTQWQINYFIISWTGEDGLKDKLVEDIEKDVSYEYQEITQRYMNGLSS